MSTAEQIIAEHRVKPYLTRIQCRCGEMFASYEQHAAHVVAALTNAGKTIVELPAGIEDDDGQVWFDDLDIRVDCTGQSRPYDVWVDDERLWYVGRAKRRAAAFWLLLVCRGR
ncbi:hypothetical protein GS580_27675 [Rhodococcus hoagii]|nr:hypothetical protein [Prescottella equi]